MSEPHRLDVLLAPRSIAFVGASARRDTPGNDMIRMATLGGFPGAVYPINPNYETVEGLTCYPSLADLPESVDHVVLGVANPRLEAGLQDAIAHGARAATIFASCYLPDDGDPPLARRLARLAREAGLALCGGNGMGFYNLALGLRVAAFPSAADMTPGTIAWIAQSGSVFGALAHNDRRLRFNLCVSSGAELVTSCADYLDWALRQDSTGVVGLFLESVRDPGLFEEGLRQAAERDIPVVVLKVGRTQTSAAMARTHTGAIAGNDAAYRALFERYGVVRVDTLDEMAATLLLFAQPKRAAAGGLATIHDSGGECGLLADLAADVGVPFARIGAATVERLRARLEPGLEPRNPLDAWATGRDFSQVFEDALAALVEDPDSAVGLMVSDVRTGYYISEGFARAALAVAARSDKPIALATNYSLVRHEALALRLTEAGLPVLDGTLEALAAVKHLLAYRDFRARPGPLPPPVPDPAASAKWRARLAAGGGLGELEGLALLADYGIAVVPVRFAASLPEALTAARAIGYPVVLKTAAPGIEHKSEHGGVKLGLRDATAVTAAYEDLAARLGPAVLVAPMLEAGVEIGIGALNDPGFGPLVMAAAGGVLIELLGDSAVALAPLDRAGARRLIAALRVAPLLEGVRGRPAANLEALAETLTRLSVLAVDLRDHLEQIDVNPVIVGAAGCHAVDVLVVARGRGS